MGLDGGNHLEKAAELAEEANRLHRAGFNCAQSVLLVLSREWGLPLGNIPAIAVAFGGGMARTGGPCGALTGALMAIGAKSGHSDAEETALKEKVNARAYEVIQSFRRSQGAVNCADIIGFSMETPEGKKRYREEDIISRFCDSAIRAAILAVMENER